MKRPPDFTYLAVRRQIEAMACAEYEIGVFDRHADRMQLRKWSPDQLLKSVPWLKVQNVAGHDIFIRPAGSVGLVFFDDLTRGAILLMSEEGLTPAVIIESSPANFHGWVRASTDPIDEATATACCKVLASRFGGDASSAEWRQFGRLAGFTNQKPKHRNERGQAPFVKIESVKKGVAANAPLLVEEAKVLMEHREAVRKARAARLQGVMPASVLKDAAAFFHSELTGLVDRYGNGIDWSRADWMVCLKMAARGYTQDQVRGVLVTNSKAAERRASHSDDYIDRTVTKAFALDLDG